MRLVRAISGGQTGGDQAGLRAARDVGLLTGGWAPYGWRTDEGPAPWLADFGLRQHESSAYPPRTEANVRASQATLIVGYPLSPGCSLTRSLCQKLKKPCQNSAWPNQDTPAQAARRAARIRAWLEANEVQVLNIAGNRERMNPGIGGACYTLIRTLLELPWADPR